MRIRKNGEQQEMRQSGGGVLTVIELRSTLRTLES